MSENYAKLVEGCRRRDAKSMRALYEMTAPMAMGVCRRYAGNRHTAQDLVQDGYVKVFEGIGKLRNPESLFAWVHEVMVNVCINHCVRGLKVESIDDLEEEPSAMPLDPFGTEEVMLALESLSPQQRMVFNLIDVEGYDNAEVAVRMKLSEATVRSLISRARLRLRALLTEENN